MMQRHQAILSAATLTVMTLGSMAPAFGQSAEEEVGLWEGPFSFVDDLSGTPTQEIAHAALLPPDDLAAPATRVLISAVPFWPIDCETSPCAAIETGGEYYGRTYLWRPARNVRSGITLIDPPEGYPQDGSQDFFCGGHAFLSDGRLLWAGGTDYKATCESDCNPSGGIPFFGTAGTWLLDTSSSTPIWESPLVPIAMSRARWYPSAVTLANGDLFVMGHIQQPIDDQLTIRDEFDSTENEFLANGRENIFYDSGVTACGDDPVLIGDYPRVHLLRNGLLMQSIRGTPEEPHADFEPEDAQYLDVKAQVWSCGNHVQGSSDNTWRWHAGTSDPPFEYHGFGSSVHLITWDPPEELGGQTDGDFTEVVYLVGGTNNGIKASDCSDGTSENVYNTVARMINPGLTSDWESVEPMEYARANHNTVILLDGSLLAVGGVRSYNGECSALLTPERYKPEEVFGVADPSWEEMYGQDQIRGYHSIALLLPDGSVISAGGDEELDGTLNTEQSLEVFYPPYCFPEADRPEIDAGDIAPTATKDYGGALEFDVTLKNSTSHVAWVALLRNGSVTHGVDMGQRFVELALSADTTQNNRLAHVQVLMPLDAYYAPPGNYMLVVVDTNDKASEAVWIQVIDT
jgi:hypothetical protein